ncbi:MAG: twin-arginine translocase subunit TatC [Alphaproteobacteria bacterium]
MSTAEDELEESRAPLIEHLIELRRRLMYSVAAFFVVFVVCVIFSQEIYGFLVKPLAQAMEGDENRRLIYTGLPEALFTQLKVAFFAAMMVAFPVIAAQIWMFVAPGLYRNERRAFLPFLVATPVLFLMGASLAYYVVFPVAWEFFLSFQTGPAQSGGLAIEFEGKVNEYLAIVMKVIFAFGFSFLLPVGLTLAGRAGLVSSGWLRDKRKYAIVATFAAAAILTPPDPFTQIALGLPILILYEISILLVRAVERKRAAT